jgi:hypothetical protein
MTADPLPPEKRYVVPSTIARWLDVNEATVRRWIASGELSALNISVEGSGRPSYRILLQELAEFLLRRGMSAAMVSELTGVGARSRSRDAT